MNEPSATTTGTRDAGRPVVGIAMGSDLGWSVMGAAAEVLDRFRVTYEADVVSVRRIPTEMIGYGRAVAERGLRVIIVGAGGAAHLPGTLAAVTEPPAIGVLVPLKYPDGMDSLLSVVQMPTGVPVATVSISGTRNAGLLAVRILAPGQGPEAARLGAVMRASQADSSEVAHARGAALREWLSH